MISIDRDRLARWIAQIEDSVEEIGDLAGDMDFVEALADMQAALADMQAALVDSDRAEARKL
jgi:hypothetical protein